MTSTIEISKVVPQFLVYTSNVVEEVHVVDVDSTKKEEHDEIDKEEEPEWDD